MAKLNLYSSFYGTLGTPEKPYTVKLWTRYQISDYRRIFHQRQSEIINHQSEIT